MLLKGYVVQARLNSVCSDLHTRVLELRQSPVGDQDVVPFHKINLNFSVFHSACRAMSYIVLLCFDNSWRYKCKLVAFAINLPVGTEGSPGLTSLIAGCLNSP